MQLGRKIGILCGLFCLSFAVSAEATTLFMIASVGGDREIGRWTVGDPEYVSLITNRPGDIREFQLVPALQRIYWCELEFPSSTRAYYSSRIDGTDIRSEFGITGGVIGPDGEFIYYYDSAASQFARVRLDGTLPELLGFGQGRYTGRYPAIDPTGSWIYFKAQALEPLDEVEPEYAIVRGNVENGNVEELALTPYSSLFDFFPFAPRFDLQNNLIFTPYRGLGEEGQYAALDFDSFQRFGGVPYWEGEGIFATYTFDPNGKFIYYVPSGGIIDPRPIYRVAYADLPLILQESQFFEFAEIVFAPPSEEATPSNAAEGFPNVIQLLHSPAIEVPEPTGWLPSIIALAGVSVAAQARRRSA